MIIKRILPILLALSLFLGIGASAANTLSTSFSPDNFLNFTIKGNKLEIRGKLIYDNLTEGWAQFGYNSVGRVNFKVSDGEEFFITLPLPKDNGTHSLQLYFAPKNSKYYYGYITRQVLIKCDGAGNYQFVESPVLKNNLEKLSGFVNPADCISDVSKEIKNLSDSIVGDTSDEYDKLFKIYRWITENIYYDRDYYYGRTTETAIKPDEVIAERKTVCQGFAETLKALINAQNIPAIITSTYALGASTDGNPLNPSFASAEESNHAHVEAYVGGRWMTLDVTWDTNNKYENGKMMKNPSYGYSYFDVSPEMFAMSHKIIRRDTAKKENTPSNWALSEVSDALSLGIVPLSVQKNYRGEISRADFCRLLIEMLCKKYGAKDEAELLKWANVPLGNNPFTDVTDTAVLAANALGIVNGRGQGKFDPDTGINRQEAAVILSRTAEFMKLSENTKAPAFTDTKNVAAWAKEGIKSVSSIKNTDGKLIMGGTSATTFEPLGKYTVEQSILTVLRLFKAK